MKIVCMFNLKPGIDPAVYEAWARGSDMPAVNALGSVTSFTIHKATGLVGSDAAAPYEYIEITDVPRLDDFIAEISKPAFQALVAPFRDFADDPAYIVTADL